jgi:hypothetical protein
MAVPVIVTVYQLEGVKSPTRWPGRLECYSIPIRNAPLLEVMSLNTVARTLVDRFGAAWSLLCAVHCAVLPLVLVLMPSLALGVWWDEGVERMTVSGVTLVALSSLGLGYRRHHGWSALLLGVPGLTLMWMALLVAPVHESVPAHALAMACGGVLVGLAHLLNLRLNSGHVRSASCAHPPHA